MKTCSKCHLEKHETEFAINKTKKDGLSLECKECHRNYNKAYYKKNYEAERKRLKERKEQQRKILENYLSEVKLKCERCPENRFAALDFHHKDPNQKDFGISFAVANGLNLERVKEEIAKCEIICSNCHRVEHWGIV